MANALEKIRHRAKQIRKHHPSMQWKSAIKKASAEYRAGKIGAVHHRRKRSVTVKTKRRPARIRGNVTKSRTHTDYNKPEVNISIGSLKGALKRRIKAKLANQLLRRETATTRKGYNLARKAVLHTKSELRKLS